MRKQKNTKKLAENSTSVFTVKCNEKGENVLNEERVVGSKTDGF